MAPRSWRPESSLAVNVPEDAAANHLNDIGVTDIEQFMTAPLDGDVEKEVETISWSLSSNVVTTMSFMERWALRDVIGNRHCNFSKLLLNLSNIRSRQYVI